MNIISITRLVDTLGIPDTFVLGEKPLVGGEPVEDSPIVSELSYFFFSPPYVRIYQGPLYVVKFKDSDIRRIIPENKVLDIAVDTTKNNDKNEKDIGKLPNLAELGEK